MVFVIILLICCSGGVIAGIFALTSAMLAADVFSVLKITVPLTVILYIVVNIFMRNK